MRTTRNATIGVMAVVALLVSATTSQAQATRTWVSGVGDDANPCSRTAPCKTFAGAISKTAAGGEIDALDPGGFGAVTITKSISIDGGYSNASILAASVTGINIPSTAVGVKVGIRNLSINGAGFTPSPGTRGISVTANGAVLHVDNCTIFGFTAVGSGIGIDFAPTAVSFLLVSNSVLRNNAGGGILIRTPVGGAGTRRAMISNTVLQGNGFGLKVDSSQGGSSSFATAREVVASANGLAGFHTTGSGATLALHQSIASANTNGIQADASTTIRLLDSASISNITSDSTGAGVITQSNNSHIGPP